MLTIKISHDEINGYNTNRLNWMKYEGRNADSSGINWFRSLITRTYCKADHPGCNVMSIPNIDDLQWYYPMCFNFDFHRKGNHFNRNIRLIYFYSFYNVSIFQLFAELVILLVSSCGFQSIGLFILRGMIGQDLRWFIFVIY